MWNLKEFNPQISRISDLLPWAFLIAEGVVLNKDASFQATFHIRGRDLDSSMRSELISMSGRLNNVLRRFGSGWAAYCDAQRIPSIDYPESVFPDVVSYLIDKERQYYFQSGRHFESEYFLTLVYLPPQEVQNKLQKLVLLNEESEGKDIDDNMYRYHLKTFTTEMDRLFYLLGELIPECRKLNNDETVTYLHSTVSPKRHPVITPEVPMYLDAYIADTEVVGGTEPMLGDHYIGVISILSFPGSTMPGILDALNHLNFEYRWVTRFIFLDKLDAASELKNYRRQWFAKRKSIMTMIKEQIMRSESALGNTDALNKAGDADVAITELEADLVGYGYYTATVIVLEKDKKKLEENLRTIEKTINNRGFTTYTEGMNALDAWLGSIPGMCRSNVRRPILHTMNLSHLFPLSAVWAGPRENEHLDAPPLLFSQTKGSAHFRLSLHIGDVGHTMIVGPTGAGKSVLLALICAQFRRYKDAQVYIFDKGASCRVLTAGVGGDFYDLANTEGHNSLAFQPLSRIDEEIERTWAQEWILQYFSSQHMDITPEIKTEVWDALEKLSSAPVEQRTIFGLQMALQEERLRMAIQDMTINGPYGRIFDYDHDNLGYGRWQAFEMETLMYTKGAVTPTLDYLFHRIEQNCLGAPTIIVLDECWTFLDNPMFAAKIREWLKVMRKKNVSIVFATQSLGDIADSTIAPAILDSCPTKIFLPNANAMDERWKALYYSFGLNDREREILTLATPKRQYYYSSAQGKRLFDLMMGPCALAYCAASGPEDQAVCKELLAKDPAAFNYEWLVNHKNLPDAWAFLQQEEVV